MSNANSVGQDRTVSMLSDHVFLCLSIFSSVHTRLLVVNEGFVLPECGNKYEDTQEKQK